MGSDPALRNLNAALCRGALRVGPAHPDRILYFLCNITDWPAVPRAVLAPSTARSQVKLEGAFLLAGIDHSSAGIRVHCAQRQSTRRTPLAASACQPILLATRPRHTQQVLLRYPH